MADAWEAAQAKTSQMQRTPDIYVSTLHKYFEAPGSKLEIRAAVPDQTLRVSPATPSGGRLPDHLYRTVSTTDPAFEIPSVVTSATKTYLPARRGTK